jgi:hypothetical protein
VKPGHRQRQIRSASNCKTGPQQARSLSSLRRQAALRMASAFAAGMHGTREGVLQLGTCNSLLARSLGVRGGGWRTTPFPAQKCPNGARSRTMVSHSSNNEKISEMVARLHSHDLGDGWPG